MTAIHFVDFEISREKGDFLKTTMWHLGLNRGSIKYRGSKKSFPTHKAVGIIISMVLVSFKYGIETGRL